MRISDWSSDACSSDRLTIEPTRWLNFSFSGAYVDQKIDDVKPFGPLTLSKNDVMLPTPKFSGTAAVRAILPIHPLAGELAFHAQLHPTSAIRPPFGTYTPGHNVFNARQASHQNGARNH